jgi:hypothetical protein
MVCSARGIPREIAGELVEPFMSALHGTLGSSFGFCDQLTACILSLDSKKR